MFQSEVELSSEIFRSLSPVESGNSFPESFLRKRRLLVSTDQHGRSPRVLILLFRRFFSFLGKIRDNASNLSWVQNGFKITASSCFLFFSFHGKRMLQNVSDTCSCFTWWCKLLNCARDRRNSFNFNTRERCWYLKRARKTSCRLKLRSLWGWYFAVGGLLLNVLCFFGGQVGWCHSSNLGKMRHF